MKPQFLSVMLLFCFGIFCHSQVFFQVEDIAEAELVVCFVDHGDSADAIIFFTDTLGAQSPNAVWHMTTNKFIALKSIFFTQDPEIAELRILKSDRRQLARWLRDEQLFWIQP